MGSNLNFYYFILNIHSSMKRLIQIFFWLSYPISTWFTFINRDYRWPELMNDSLSMITILSFIYDDADAQKIIDLLESKLFRVHFLVNTVDMLRSARNLRL